MNREIHALLCESNRFIGEILMSSGTIETLCKRFVIGPKTPFFGIER